jgi:hypothetical protein
MDSSTAIPLRQRPLDLLFIIYFVVHIPTALLLDVQSILPRHLFHEELLKMTEGHIKSTGDPLVSTNPVWFKALVWCELILQVPYFFAATYAFIKGEKICRTYDRCPRKTCLDVCSSAGFLSFFQSIG